MSKQHEKTALPTPKEPAQESWATALNNATGNNIDFTRLGNRISKGETKYSWEDLGKRALILGSTGVGYYTYGLSGAAVGFLGSHAVVSYNTAMRRNQFKSEADQWSQKVTQSIETISDLIPKDKKDQFKKSLEKVRDHINGFTPANGNLTAKRLIIRSDMQSMFAVLTDHCDFLTKKKGDASEITKFYNGNVESIKQSILHVAKTLKSQIKGNSLQGAERAL